MRSLLPTPLGVRLFPVHGKPMERGPQRPLVRLAHVTDLHFCAAKLPRYPSGPAVLSRTVAALNAQDLDAVVFSGDLFDLPERLHEDAPAFAELMRDLRHPWFVAFGNHDVEGRRAHRRKAYLSGILGDHGVSRSAHPWYHAPIGPGVHLVVLDTTDNGEDDYLTWRGHFSERQAQWLDGKLTELSGDMVILALHHPPVEPYPLMDALKFSEPDKRRLKRVLQKHAHAPVMLCGHYHMAGCLPFAHTGVMAGPGLIEHPHQYRVFDISPENGLITFHAEEVEVPEDECSGCVTGSARLRSRLLGNLSHAHSGHLRLPEAR
jgi:3',5'-cyclic AMP phosphodiesterase CpdA